MLSSRERFLGTLEFAPVDEPWLRSGSFVWDETLELWKTQGYQGQDVDECLGLDKLVRVDPWYGPAPNFEYQVIEEDDRTITYINHEGILMREFKEQATSSMPQFVKFPVENEEDFDRFAAERLVLRPELRFTQEWKQQVKSASPSEKNNSAKRDWPRLCAANCWGGFFGPLRTMMGIEKLCYAFYDQPELIERMMSERAEAIITITGQALVYTPIEIFWFWEDMAYNHGPLIDPDMFAKLAKPHYRRVCEWLRQQGIKHIGLDSDGDIHKLIPIWLEVGINVLFPFEVQAGMDVNKVRQTYGHDLAMIGGVDKKAISQGPEAMRREVDRIAPLVADGGYIPELDHGVPPDISWPAFCEYIDYLKYRLGRG